MQSTANNIFNFVKVNMRNIEKSLAATGPHSSTGCGANLNEIMMRSKLEPV